MFVLPSWALVDHAATTESDLFVISDAPVIQRLGLYREATVAGPQPIQSTFEAKA
jgi:gentisate 1,2-dioxygenase